MTQAARSHTLGEQVIVTVRRILRRMLRRDLTSFCPRRRCVGMIHPPCASNSSTISCTRSSPKRRRLKRSRVDGFGDSAAEYTAVDGDSEPACEDISRGPARPGSHARCPSQYCLEHRKRSSGFWRRRSTPPSGSSSLRTKLTMLPSEHMTRSSSGINDDEKKERGLADVSHIDTEKSLCSV